jgi:hypothetical protein
MHVISSELVLNGLQQSGTTLAGADDITLKAAPAVLLRSTSYSFCDVQIVCWL